MTSTIPTTAGSSASRRGAFTSSILILSNLAPLAGILLWGWDTFVGGALVAQAIGNAAPLIVLVLLKTAIEIRFPMKLRSMDTTLISYPTAN